MGGKLVAFPEDEYNSKMLSSHIKEDGTLVQLNDGGEWEIVLRGKTMPDIQPFIDEYCKECEENRARNVDIRCEEHDWICVISNLKRYLGQHDRGEGGENE